MGGGVFLWARYHSTGTGLAVNVLGETQVSTSSRIRVAALLTTVFSMSLFPRACSAHAGHTLHIFDISDGPRRARPGISCDGPTHPKAGLSLPG